MSLFLKALPLMALRPRPSFFFICSVPRVLSRTRTASFVSALASPLIQPPLSAFETVTSNANTPLALKESLDWVSRTACCGELSSNDVGKRVQLCGWVALHRVHGGLTFLNLRGHSGIVQVTTFPDEFPDAHSAINDLRLEYVVAIEGVVRSRPSESIDNKMKTSLIEVAATRVQVLNAVNSKLPFLVTTADDAKDSLKEEIRLRYRCLDLRRQQMSFNILLRHKVVKLMRRYLEDIHGFVEPGTFYALPQSPQLFKQMIMVAGFDKYCQLASWIWTFMFSTASLRGARHGFSFTFKRHSLFKLCYLVEDFSTVASSSTATSCFRASTPHTYIHQRTHSAVRHLSKVSSIYSPSGFLLFQRSNIFGRQGILRSLLPARYISNESVELKTDYDIVRFSLGTPDDVSSAKKSRKKKMSRKAKLNELRFYRLKAKKKMNSPNPEVRIRYKLGKAKRKETWLIEKLRKFDVPKAPPETYDPEILTEEEKHYLKRIGEKKKHFVLLGRRGVFGGVVLNMHLHWKNHETVKVICKPCKPGQVHEYAEELARLSKGILIDIKPNNTIIFYRGKNYVQPKVMSPPYTLSKAKALEKYRYEQSLEHTSQFIEKLEKELEEYHQHRAKFKKGKEDTTKGVEEA